MRKVFFFFFNLCAATAFSQSVDVKDKVVYVDKASSFRFEKEGCTIFSQTCLYTIYDSTGKRQVIINGYAFKDPLERKQGNPEGNVNYLEFVFLEAKQKAEIPFTGEKGVMKTLIKARIMQNGMLNAEAVDEFVLTKGRPFSERRARM